MRLTDATRCRAAPPGKRPGGPSWRDGLAEWAGYGYCRSHSRWYWGLKLYLLTTPDGMPAAWCLASPKIREREVAAELLAHAARTGALRPGPILIGDKGFAGQGSSTWSPRGTA